MTVIVAVVHEGRVMMGADSFCSAGNRRIEERQGKLWTTEDMVIGTAGNNRAADVYRHGFTAPPVMQGQDPDTYMRFTYPGALRTFLQEHAPVGVDGASEDCGLSALIGWGGRIWELGEDFSVVEATEPYAAIGSGGDVARGALFCLDHLLSARDRLTCAMRAATRFTGTVRAPYVFAEEPA